MKKQPRQSSRSRKKGKVVRDSSWASNSDSEAEEVASSPPVSSSSSSSSSPESEIDHHEHSEGSTAAAAPQLDDVKVTVKRMSSDLGVLMKEHNIKSIRDRKGQVIQLNGTGDDESEVDRWVFTYSVGLLVSHLYEYLSLQ